MTRLPTGICGMSKWEDDIYSYDEVPYHSWPYRQSHPDRLATIALLFGMEPQPIERARILELGCAGGGNLIPMAETLPGSRFVGIDLSERELAEAQSLVEQLQLKNVELIHNNIVAVDQELGKFHYIIVHGLFSWVPPEVQDRILQICRENLEPNGVAYVSYNTYPGWRMRGMIRDMVCYHTEQLTGPRERVSQARALLRFLSRSAVNHKNAYAAYLAEELGLFSQVEDYYLFHDHLEKVNEPVYFWQFVQRAKAHDLQFLGEADFSTMFAGNLSDDVAATLERITQDIVQMEQYLDFVRNRTFRQTLLCHAENVLQRKLGLQSVETLYVSSRLKPESDDLDVRGAESVRFSGPNVHLETASPLVKAALVHLAAVWPSWVPFRSLVMTARSRIHPAPVQDAKCVERDGQKLGDQLIQCYASNAVELHAMQPPFTIEISDRPAAAPLARLQAESGPQVTNRRGETVTLTEMSRHTICCLDGSTDQGEIIDRLMNLVVEETLVVQTGGQPVSDHSRVRAILRGSLGDSLRELANHALLVG